MIGEGEGWWEMLLQRGYVTYTGFYDTDCIIHASEGDSDSIDSRWTDKPVVH